MEIALIIAQILIKYTPAAAEAWQKIFSKPDPTPADWKEIWAVPYEKDYSEYTAPKEKP